SGAASPLAAEGVTLQDLSIGYRCDRTVAAIRRARARSREIASLPGSSEAARCNWAMAPATSPLLSAARPAVLARCAPAVSAAGARGAALAAGGVREGGEARRALGARAGAAVAAGRCGAARGG